MRASSFSRDDEKEHPKRILSCNTQRAFLSLRLRLRLRVCFCVLRASRVAVNLCEMVCGNLFHHKEDRNIGVFVICALYKSDFWERGILSLNSLRKKCPVSASFFPRVISLSLSLSLSLLSLSSTDSVRCNLRRRRGLLRFYSHPRRRRLLLA